MPQPTGFVLVKQRFSSDLDNSSQIEYSYDNSSLRDKALKSIGNQSDLEPLHLTTHPSDLLNMESFDFKD